MSAAIILAVFDALMIWAFVANEITFRRMGKESDIVHSIRMQIINRCAEMKDFTDLDAWLAAVPYPPRDAYHRVMVRTLFLLDYNDILPFSTQEQSQ